MMKTNKLLSARLISSIGFAFSFLFYSQTAYPLSFVGQNFVQYGDGQSFSLPISAFLSCSGNPCQYDIQSSPGQIKDLVVVATGADGQPVNTNFAGMDNAYSTPTGTNSAPFFRTGDAVTSPDPGGAGQFGTGGVADSATTWDTTLGALQTFLAGDSLVFFFNNNQTNSGSAADQNLAGWARITIRDGSGNIVNSGGDLIGMYDFTNNGGNYALVTQGGGGVINGDVATFTSTGAQPTGAAGGSPTDYVLSGGAICIDAVGLPVACPGANGPFNHNLGADHAAYAIIFPELNAQLASLFATLTPAQLAAFSMNIDLRLGCDPAFFATSAACLGKSLNNGYEQLFFGPLEHLVIPPLQVPEPTSLLLLGSGLLALVGWRIHRK